MRIRFADFLFDSDARQVVRKGQPLPRSPKALELLGALLLSRPRAPLADGDEICVGAAVLIFRAGGSLGSTETGMRESR